MERRTLLGIGRTLHRWRDGETGIRYRLRDYDDGIGPVVEALNEIRGNWTLIRPVDVPALEREIGYLREVYGR